MPTSSHYWTLLLNTLRRTVSQWLQKEKHKTPPQPPVWQSLNTARHQSEVSLADLLIATTDLPWENEKQLQQIAHSLGFSWQELAESDKPEQPTKGAYDPNAYNTRLKPKKKTKIPHLSDTAPPPPDLPIDLSPHAQLLSSELQPRIPQETATAIPEWLTNGDRTEFPPLLEGKVKDKDKDKDKDTPTRQPLNRDNLLSNTTSRGILSASLAIQRRGTQPDIPQIIHHIVRGELLKDIPRTMETRISQGCQLLLDYNPTLTPYWQDLNSLSQQIENVIGQQNVQVFEFENNPLLAKHWISRRKTKSWQAQAGVPVLIASNVTQIPYKHTTAIPDHWHEFIQRCQQKQAPLLIFIPWQQSQWPTDLGSYPLLIHWNPKTTANMVRQLVGKGHEVSP